MVPSAFAYHATINRSLLTPATTKCDQSSTLSSTLGQCKDLEARVGDVDEPMIPTRVVRRGKRDGRYPDYRGGYGEEIYWLEVG